jgi:hypothetical protein
LNNAEETHRGGRLCAERQSPDPPIGTPDILGVDDFALRPGRPQVS